MSLTLDPTLINNLNQLKQIPIPICKLIIDQICKTIINSNDGINYKMIERIIKIQCKFLNQNNCNWRSAIKSLHYLIKYSLKNQYPGKAVGIFLTTKTFLSDLAEYICQKYQQLQSSTIAAPKQAKLQQISWAVCNLRQNKNKQLINKMYMKLYLRTLENGEQAQKVINCQLSQFKLLLSEISQATTNMK